MPLGEMQLERTYMTPTPDATEGPAEQEVFLAWYEDADRNRYYAVCATRSIARYWIFNIVSDNWDSDWNEVSHTQECDDNDNDDCDCESERPEDMDDMIRIYFENRDDETYDIEAMHIKTE